jgi:hypothetical protein
MQEQNSSKLSLRRQELTSGVVHNIDGEPIKYTPCGVRDHYLAEVKQGPTQSYYLGGIVSAPRHVLECPTSKINV